MTSMHPHPLQGQGQSTRSGNKDGSVRLSPSIDHTKENVTGTQKDSSFLSAALPPVTTALLSTSATHSSAPSGSVSSSPPSPSFLQQFRDLFKTVSWPSTFRESPLFSLFRDSVLRRHREGKEQDDLSRDEADIEELNRILSRFTLQPSTLQSLSASSTRSSSPSSQTSENSRTQAKKPSSNSGSDMDTDDSSSESHVDEELAATFILDALFNSGDVYCSALHTEVAQLINKSPSAFYALRSFVQSSGFYFSEAPTEGDSAPIEELKDDAVDLITWEALEQADCRPLLVHLSGPLAREASLRGQSPSTVSFPSSVLIELNGETSHATITGQPVSWKHGTFAVSLLPLKQLFPVAATRRSTLRVNFLIHIHLDAEPLRGHVWVMSAAAEEAARRHRNESEFASRLVLIPLWPSTVNETQSFLDVSPLLSCLSDTQQSRFRKELSLLTERIRSVGTRLSASPILLGALALLRLGLTKEGLASLVLAAMGNHIAMARMDLDTQRGSQSQRDALLQGAELFCLLMLQEA